MKARSALRAIVYHGLLQLPNLILILCISLFCLLVRRVWLACTVVALLTVAYHVFLRRRYTQMLFNRILLAPHRAGMSEEYRLTLCYAGIDARSSYWLSASYDVGDYQTVVDICTYYLRHPRRRQPPKYFYLRFLADVYKTVGDRDKLERVCDAYDELLAREPSPEKFRYFAPVFENHRAYLKENEQASDTSAEILPHDDYKPGITRYGIAALTSAVLLCLLAVLLVITATPSLLESQYQRRMAKLCVPAVKQTHVDAQYLAYLPIYTDDEYLADLCLYEVNGEVWVGELYVRTNHMDVPLLSPSVAIAVDLLEDPSKMPATLEVPGFLNDVTIMCMIYREQADIPSIFNVYEPFELNGHTYYFVVTKVIAYY